MNELEIEAVLAWEALDSRGTPTVGCEVRLAGGARGDATVPSGASTGAHEARELRDGGERYEGRGVRQAVANVKGELAGAVIGLDGSDQARVDAALLGVDDSLRYSRLGANAVLAVSTATAIAAAAAKQEPLYRTISEGTAPLLPMPMVNIVSGGAHAGWSMEIQDVLAVPVGASSFTEAIEWTARVRRATAELLESRGHITALVADEGGLGPALESGRMAVEIVSEAIERCGFEPAGDVAIALDIAATQLVRDSGYRFGPGEESVSSEEVLSALADWVGRYPIVSIEDPLGEDDWAGWALAGKKLGSLQLLGDDLFVTDPERLARGIEAGIGNAILVKPNQNGALSGTREVVAQARAAGYATVLSARSGETEDSWLADLAVGWRTGQIKVGSTMRSERTAKWNRLLQIEAELGDRSEFAGRDALAR